MQECILHDVMTLDLQNKRIKRKFKMRKFYVKNEWRDVPNSHGEHCQFDDCTAVITRFYKSVTTLIPCPI